MRGFFLFPLCGRTIVIFLSVELLMFSDPIPVHNGSTVHNNIGHEYESVVLLMRHHWVYIGARQWWLPLPSAGSPCLSSPGTAFWSSDLLTVHRLLTCWVSLLDFNWAPAATFKAVWCLAKPPWYERLWRVLSSGHQVTFALWTPAPVFICGVSFTTFKVGWFFFSGGRWVGLFTSPTVSLPV